MPIWIEPSTSEPTRELVQATGDPLIARIIMRRGIVSPGEARAFLDPNAYSPSPPHDIPDLAYAAGRIRQAITRNERILVWGDFDVDGQTATALLVSALRELDGRVNAYIPHRLHEGHGIQPAPLQKQLHSVDLLLTCDTGVAEHEAVEIARRHGVTVLVTDHHELPPELPNADAIVNPKRLPLHHPLRELPGVGVAFKLCQQVFDLMDVSGSLIDESLDLVALGIVADVATQNGDTRYLLQRGLPCLRDTHRLGLQALMKEAQVNPRYLTTHHIGFGLGPRLNALGRLGDANLAVELLTTDDLIHARILAAQLEGLNQRRRLLTDQIYSEAQKQIARDPTLLDSHALVLSESQWHRGVIGIVASRLAEFYCRPVVLICEDEDGLGRGSARSVSGVDIFKAISTCKSILTRYGGHAGAAGVSLPNARIWEFRNALSTAVGSIWDKSATSRLEIDAVVPWEQTNLELVDRLNVLSPFGAGNPPIVVVSQHLELVSQRLFGRDSAHRQLTIRDEKGTTRKVTWWRGAGRAVPSGRFDLAFTLKATDYRGERGLEIEYVEAREVRAPIVAIAPPTVQVIDHRSVADPIQILDDLSSETEIAVWAEGHTDATFPSTGKPRDQLAASSDLAIWTPPPGPREMREVLERTSPQIVHLFAIGGKNLDPDRFLPHLAGLIKYTLHHKEGIVDLARLAAITAQRAESVRCAVRLLEARGDVRVIKEGTATMSIAQGDGQEKPTIEEIQAGLQALLQETAAYRAYYSRAAPESLV